MTGKKKESAQALRRKGTSGGGVVKLRSEWVEASAVREKSVWVHNGQGFVQVAPRAKEAVGLKYGRLVPCHRTPKHPKKKGPVVKK